MQKSLVPAVLLALGLATTPAFAASSEKAPAPAKGTDTYPLKTCVVSGEPLGSMGEFVAYTHSEPGKPDRVVRFCCDGCIDDFKKEPAKFLKKIDDAAAEAKKAPAPAKKAGAADAKHAH